MYVNFKGKPERSKIVAVKPHRTSLVPGNEKSIKLNIGKIISHQSFSELIINDLKVPNEMNSLWLQIPFLLNFENQLSEGSSLLG